MSLPAFQMDRRTLLKSLLAASAVAGMPAAGAADPVAASNRFRGLFPIAASPFTPQDKLDLDCLSAQVDFCDRARIPGLIWPQIASGWTTLSAPERFAGAEAMLATRKGGQSAVVIGVQTRGNDLQGAIAFAQHATRHGADAVCSLPPEGSDADALAYYRAIGSATDLPLFVQTSGNMSVELVTRIADAVPTTRVVKDEAGDPLARVSEIRQKTGGRIAVFAGRGVRQMMDEMRLGFTGFCPTMGLADLFQQAWELHEAGKPREAFDMFGRIQAFSSSVGADRYVLVARGIFKESTRSRPAPGMGSPGISQAPLTEAEKQNVRDALKLYLSGYLRA